MTKTQTPHVWTYSIPFRFFFCHLLNLLSSLLQRRSKGDRRVQQQEQKVSSAQHKLNYLPIHNETLQPLKSIIKILFTRTSA